MTPAQHDASRDPWRLRRRWPLCAVVLAALSALVAAQGTTVAPATSAPAVDEKFLGELGVRYSLVNDPSTKVDGKSVARPIPVALVVRAGTP